MVLRFPMELFRATWAIIESVAGLTAKLKAFVDEYLIDMNASQAAIRAGYSSKTANATGQKVLLIPTVKTLVNAALVKRSETTGIDAEWVLRKLGAIFTADVLDIISENGAYKPIREWPPVWRQMLSGIDIREMFGHAEDEDGNVINEKIGEVVRLRFIDRLRTLELIGKHVGVQAFKDREITVPINLVFGADDVKL